MLAYTRPVCIIPPEARTRSVHSSCCAVPGKELQCCLRAGVGVTLAGVDASDGWMVRLPLPLAGKQGNPSVLVSSETFNSASASMMLSVFLITDENEECTSYIRIRAWNGTASHIDPGCGSLRRHENFQDLDSTLGLFPGIIKLHTLSPAGSVNTTQCLVHTS